MFPDKSTSVVVHQWLALRSGVPFLQCPRRMNSRSGCYQSAAARARRRRVSERSPSRSKRLGVGCCCCHPTARNGTRSSRAGARSRSSCTLARRVRCRRSKPLWSTRWMPYRSRMPTDGFITAVTGSLWIDPQTALSASRSIACTSSAWLSARRPWSSSARRGVGKRDRLPHWVGA